MNDLIVQLLNGLVVGLSLAMVASGLALVFGVLDIVNFAQGELYMLGGYAVLFTVEATGNFALGVVVAALVVGVLGGVVLQAVVWPLLERSTVLSLLATLGLSLIVRQLAINVFGGTTRRIATPIEGQVPVGGLNYPIYNISIVLIGAVILTGGFLFLKYTRYGIWIRAVAENRPMAAALGVPVPRVYLVAFMLSAGLAALAGALLAPLTSVYATIGGDVIINAFIVVVAGGMGNFRGAALVAVLLGEVESVGSIWFRPVEVQVFALGLVILILAMRSRGKSAGVAVQPVARAAARIRASSGRLVEPGYAVLAALLIILAVYAGLAGGTTPQRVAVYLIFGLLAVGVAMITGFARLFNIGIGAIFGVSAYTVALLTQQSIFNPFILFGAAILAGLLMSVLFGVYTNVASGIEYMMLTFLTTLAMSRIPDAAPKLTGGDNGLQVKGGLVPSFGLNPLVGNQFYFFVLAVVLICLGLSWLVLNSQSGRAARAVGRNATRASAMGYNAGQYRMALTLLSGFVAAAAGWLYALDNSFVSQDLLGLGNSLNGLLYALVGGAEHVLLGPILGATGFRYLTDSLGRLTSQSTLYIGLALMIVVYLMPDGLLGLGESAIRRLAHVSRRRSAKLEPLPTGGDAVDTRP